MRRLVALSALAVLVCTGCATGVTGNAQSVDGAKTRFSGAFVSTARHPVEWWVQYGTTSAYGSESAHTVYDRAVDPYEPHNVSVDVDGLELDTTYHYRFCARDSDQTEPACGEDRTHTTPNVDCGDVITHDLTLGASLGCEESDAGLVIGANGVDLNLNGHSLTGVPADSPAAMSGTGVDNRDGYDDLTIRNGELRQWGTGIRLEGASFNLIRNVVVGPGALSVRVAGGESNVIRSAALPEAVPPTGPFVPGLVASGTDGLVVADSSGTSWSIAGSDSRIVRNELDRGVPSCLVVRGNRNRVVENSLYRCHQDVLVIEAGANNELIDNELSSDPTGEGFSSADSDGIFVGAFAAGTLLDGNHSFSNHDDGIDVRAVDTRLKDNRADINYDFGIDTVAGVTDLGGNTASGNGSFIGAPQCRNVFCAPSP
jgi:hypothetical protein